MKKILSVLVALYLGFCASIYFYPQVYFYNPSKEAPNVENAKANGFYPTVLEYQARDMTDLFAWYNRPQNANGKVIVFMHGNSHNIEAFYYKVIPFVKAGYAVMLPEYRGFGGLRGDITQHNLAIDAIASVNELYKLGYKNKDIYVYGLSLGTYLATNTVCALQKNESFAGLILEVPFDSLLNTAKKQTPIYAPLDYLLKDKYNTFEIIKEVKTKTLFMLGSKDKTIPYELGKALYNQASQPKELVIYKGAGHSDLFNYGNDKDVLRWLEK